MNELLTEAQLVAVEWDRPIPKNEFLFFVVAYWPSGKWWKIFPERYLSPNDERIKEAIAVLKNNGWDFIHIVKLPEYKKLGEIPGYGNEKGGIV